MKKTLMNVLLSLAIVSLLYVVGASSVITEAFQSGYERIRQEANEDPNTTIGSTLVVTDTNSDYAQIPANAFKIKATSGGTTLMKAVQIIFCGGDAANDTFTYTVYAWRADNGPAEMVCTGVGTLGTQQVVKYPHDKTTATDRFWADTITYTSYWIGAVSVADSGNNRIAKLLFNANGYKYLYVQITNADDTTGTEAGNVSVYFSY